MACRRRLLSKSPNLRSLPHLSRSRRLEKTVEGQWPSIHEEWASERERLTSAQEEWESKVKAIWTNLGTIAAKFDAGLAGLAVLQQHQQQQQASQPLGLGNGEVVKELHGSGRGRLDTPPSPRTLNAVLNRPWQRKGGSSRARAGRGGEVIGDYGVGARTV